MLTFELLLPAGNFISRTASRTAAAGCHMRGFTNAKFYDDKIDDDPVVVVPLRLENGQVLPMPSMAGEVKVSIEPEAVVLTLPPLLLGVASLHIPERVTNGKVRVAIKPGTITTFNVPNVGLVGVRFP